jgi:hypothetical protein
VHVIELDPPTLYMGDDLNRQALTTFRACTESGEWPGYNDYGITMLSAPTWALRQHEDEVAPW